MPRQGIYLNWFHSAKPAFDQLQQLQWRGAFEINCLEFAWPMTMIGLTITTKNRNIQSTSSLTETPRRNSGDSIQTTYWCTTTYQRKKGSQQRRKAPITTPRVTKALCSFRADYGEILRNKIYFDVLIEITTPRVTNALCSLRADWGKRSLLYLSWINNFA